MSLQVYLSWSLPECSSGCPGSWLGDGYCDTSCNTSACEWDGGDCTGGKGDGAGLDMDYDFGVDDTPDFCASSCSDLWLADKYCDHVSFDSGSYFAVCVPLSAVDVIRSIIIHDCF